MNCRTERTRQREVELLDFSNDQITDVNLARLLRVRLDLRIGSSVVSQGSRCGIEIWPLLDKLGLCLLPGVPVGEGISVQLVQLALPC